MPLSIELIDNAVERYWREYDRYSKLAEFVGDTCRKALESNVIRGSIQWRAKDPDRLRAKLTKYLSDGAHSEEFTDMDSVFRVLKDLAGARVTTYVEADRHKVVALIGKQFSGFADDGTVFSEDKDKAGHFYRATHCMVRLRDQDLIGRYQNLKDLGCEVQVCSLLAHVYNEIEHDLRYKPLKGNLSGSEEELLDALGHMMESGDTVINHTLVAVDQRLKANAAEFVDVFDFVVRMRPLFPTAENFANNAGQLYIVCEKLGLDSPNKIKAALNWDDQTAARGERLAGLLAEHVNPNPDIQLEVDPQSSDQLWVLILGDSDRLNRIKGMYPSGRGVGRAPRFLSMAKHLSAIPNQAG